MSFVNKNMVEVIRCRDCLYFHPDTYSDNWCSAKAPGISKGMCTPSADSYCSDAVRKEQYDEVPEPYEHLTCEIKIKDGEKVIAQCSATDHCFHDLEVHQDYRRKRYASRLLDILKREFEADWLWVKADNMEAVSLYNNLGFKIVEIDDGYYKMRKEDK